VTPLRVQSLKWDIHDFYHVYFFLFDKPEKKDINYKSGQADQGTFAC
jgi:hypothetical protein